MEVVWLLDGDKLAALRRALQPPAAATGCRKRIPLESFIAEFYRAICLRQGADHGPRNQTETRQLVERMCILFELVDVDSVGVIDWEHFTDFCVCMRGRDSGNQGLEGELGAPKGGGRTPPENLTRFVEKLGYTDRSSHCHEIRSMRFVKGLDLLVVVEGTAILKIYSAGPHKLGQIEPAIAIRTLMIDRKRSTRVAGPKANPRGGGGGASSRAEGAAAAGKEAEESLAVLAMDFIGRHNQAAVSCADGYLTVWDLETFKLLRYVRLRDVQVGLRFCPAMDVLTSWGVDEFNHEIIVWDVDTLTVLHVLDGHCEAVKDTYEVAPPPLSDNIKAADKTWEPILATAGMDHKVILWDLRIGSEGSSTPRKMFVLVGHYHGVVSLAYSNEHDLIFSAGFDFDANCWDRSTSHLHMKLVGHRLSLIGVVIVEHETQRAVTGDEGGSFRLWDIQRGYSDHGTCLQAFSLRNTQVSPRSMAVVWKGGLVVAGNKMHFFRAAASVTVEASPLGAWFSSYTGELCVVLREAILFDAVTGKVKRRAFQQTHGREITAFCMDARHKKAVVGDQRGGLRMYDGITGRWLMSANSHRSEVSALLFLDEDNAFISAGWDGMIQVHDARVRSFSATRSNPGVKHAKGEKAPIGHRCAFTLRSVLNAHDGDITLMAASSRLGLIATASSDLTVRLWDYQLLRLEEVIVAHRQEITCARFLDPLPCLATADMTGKVLIWATRPHPKGGTLLLVIRNTVISAGDTVPSVASGSAGGRRTRVQRKVLPTPVTCVGFRHHIPSESDPTEVATAATRRVRQVTDETTSFKETTTKVSDHKDDERSTNTDGRVLPTARPVWEVGSMLFTGDEMGSIKVWDLTSVLLDKLGPIACGAKATEDTAAIPPASFGAASHHFVHYRKGPLDGVGLQAGVRFRELIEMARALRRGEHLQAAHPESDADTRLRRAGLDGGGSALGVGGEMKAKRFPSEAARSSTAESLSDNNTAERSRDRSSTGRRRKEPGSGCKSKAPQVEGSSNHLSLGGTASDACDIQQRVRRPVGVREQTEATLNASPDDINPVASWAGHRDSVKSMETIFDPPSIVTGSLDGSVRLFSLDGRLLGEMAERKVSVAETAAVPWRFRPPPNGRDSEARARATALEQTLKSVRHEERQPVASSGIPGGSTVPADQPLQAQCSRSSSPLCKAPTNGSEFRAASGAFSRHCSVNPVLGQTMGGAPTPTGDPAGAAAAEERGLLQTRSAVSAACLSRIKELTRVRDAEVSSSSDAESDRPQAAADSIEERLLSEARQGRGGESGVAARQSLASADGNRQGRDKRHGHHQTEDSPNGAPQPLPQRLPPNLCSELERKQAKRTRSTLQFLSDSINRASGAAGSKPALSPSKHSRSQETHETTVRGPHVTGRAQGDWCGVSSRPFTSPGVRAKGLVKKDSSLARSESESSMQETRARLSPASRLRHAVVMVAPYLAMQIEGADAELIPSQGTGAKAEAEEVAGDRAERGQEAGDGAGGGGTGENGGCTTLLPKKSTASVLGAQRPASALASARSNRSNRSCLSLTRPAVSTKAAVGRRMAADRRRRRMENILDGVRRIGVSPPQQQLDLRAADAQDRASEMEGAAGEWSAAATTGERGAGTVVISARVREVLSRFERSENGGNDDEDNASDHQTIHRVKSMRRQLDARTAARKEAIRHNERYRRAQRYDLITLKKTQLRRQEAMVGLAGPSGERFGPYSLDDVLEFRVFANQLNSQGAEDLTVRALIENPDIQADPYSDALLQELTKSGVLRWNQPLSLEDLMQVVFHFAKHEEAKRMMAVMDIALLLERLRDAFLADRNSLVGRSGALPFWFTNDIDMTFRTAGAEACGTCTVRELYGVMTRVGSDLFPSGQEELEALATQCGIADGQTELTANDFTALVVKLISLHQQHPAAITS